MSKQCPYCQSYNTEYITGAQVGSAALVVAAGFAGSLLGPFGTAAACAGAAKGTDSIDSHKCNSCGRTFKP